MERGDHPRGDVVDPDARPRPLVGVVGEEAGFVVWVRVLEVLEDDGGFVQGFCGGRGVFRFRAGEGRDEATGVEGEEGLWLVVRVHFDVLVGDLFLFEGEPDALDCVG